MKILFLTGNQHKLREAREILADYEVDSLLLDLPEIQSLDPKEIIREKLAAARRLVSGDATLMVEDVSFWIGETGLPGPFIKFFLKTVGRAGLIKFARAFGDTSARAECHVGLLRSGAKDPKFFVGKVEGRIIAPRGESGFGFDPIFLPDGHEKTFAEMAPEEKNSMSHRRLALEDAKAFLNTNL